MDLKLELERADIIEFSQALQENDDNKINRCFEKGLDVLTPNKDNKILLDNIKPPLDPKRKKHLIDLFKKTSFFNQKALFNFAKQGNFEAFKIYAESGANVLFLKGGKTALESALVNPAFSSEQKKILVTICNDSLFNPLDFHNFIPGKIQHDAVREFSLKEHSVENIDFYDQCIKLIKTITPSQNHLLESQIRELEKLNAKYLEHASEFEINVPKIFTDPVKQCFNKLNEDRGSVTPGELKKILTDINVQVISNIDDTYFRAKKENSGFAFAFNNCPIHAYIDSKANQTKLLTILLNDRKIINQKNPQGLTPLDKSLQHKNFLLAAKLLLRGAKTGYEISNPGLLGRLGGVVSAFINMVTPTPAQRSTSEAPTQPTEIQSTDSTNTISKSSIGLMKATNSDMQVLSEKLSSMLSTTEKQNSSPSVDIEVLAKEVIPPVFTQSFQSNPTDEKVKSNTMENNKSEDITPNRTRRKSI